MEKVKVLLLTSDLTLSKQLSRHIDSDSERLEIETYRTLKALGRISELGKYKAILVDETLDDSNGNEIAKYVDVFFKFIPVVVLTDDPDLLFKDIPWAACVKAVYNKRSGDSELLKRVLEMISEPTN